VGVHAAARIAALAQGGEVLASVETLDVIGGVAFGEPREVTLKGIAKPVQVATVDWRRLPDGKAVREDGADA
jgi:class 3 adenylate cyclase